MKGKYIFAVTFDEKLYTLFSNKHKCSGLYNNWNWNNQIANLTYSYQTRSFDKVPWCKDRKLLRKLQLDVIYRELLDQCISVTKAMLKIFSIFLRGPSYIKMYFKKFRRKTVKKSFLYSLFCLDFYFVPFS